MANGAALRRQCSRPSSTLPTCTLAPLVGPLDHNPRPATYSCSKGRCSRAGAASASAGCQAWAPTDPFKQTVALSECCISSNVDPILKPWILETLIAAHAECN